MSDTYTIYQCDSAPVGWAVERCEPDNDGICHRANFYGPDAEAQAWVFASVFYDKIFPHYHRAGLTDADKDRCGKCGLDLRHPIHYGRMQP